MKKFAIAGLLTVIALATAGCAASSVRLNSSTSDFLALPPSSTSEIPGIPADSSSTMRTPSYGFFGSLSATGWDEDNDFRLGFIGENWMYRNDEDEFLCVLSLRRDYSVRVYTDQYNYRGSFTVDKNKVTLTFHTRTSAYSIHDYGSSPIIEEAVEIFSAFTVEECENMQLNPSENDVYVTVVFTDGSPLFTGQQMQKPYTFTLQLG